MPRHDTRSLSAPARQRGAGALALGLSLGLHGAAFAGFVLFWEVTPAVPYAVIAVELVHAPDSAGSGQENAGEQSPSPRGRGMGRPAVKGPWDEKSTVFEAPGESDDRAAARDGEAATLSAPAPALPPERHDSVPPMAAAPVPAPVPEMSSPPDAAAAVALWIAPTPRRKPAIPSSRAGTKPANTGFAEKLAEMKGAALRSADLDPVRHAAQWISPTPRRKPAIPGFPTGAKPVDTGLAESLAELKGAAPRSAGRKLRREVARSESGRAAARPPRTSPSDGGNSDIMAALPATARGSGMVGEPDGNSGPFPRNTGGGFANAAPRYPYLARRRGQQGRVILRVRVNAGGDAAAVTIRRSSGYRLLDDAAVDAVGKWLFVPARRGGIAVAGLVDVPVSFTLTER